MDLSSTVLKALDILTILTSREDGLALPDLAIALDQPRTNVVRVVRTLQHYGLIACEGRRWMATPSFREWSAPPNRHLLLRSRYRPVVDAIATATGELTVLGLHEGNGVGRLDYKETDGSVRLACALGNRQGLRHDALGKLALSRRPDLAAKYCDSAFQRELDEVRCSGVAWNREETVRGMIAMAIPGFTNLPTEPMLAVSWPKNRFSEAAADEARQVARDLMAKVLKSA